MLINKFFEVRDQAERLRLDLLALLKQEQPNYRSRLQEEIDQLKSSLDNSKVPELFRVAVVGTFKTGKSSFVNNLLEERFAGVETNPETAAISIFRYTVEEPKAEIKLISREEWKRMEELYEDAPKHPGAYRVAGLHELNEQMAKRKSREGQPIDFTPVQVDEWLKPGGSVRIIEAKQWNTRKGKQDFRKAIREFTSSSNPLHYFVEDLIVYAPVPLLRDHMELIDTPGLNDPQIYRGQLTEELLSNIDAILFLTRSGASFDQADKEFLKRQLRKQRIRHLQLIVTQVDFTYENARRNAQEEEEELPTYEEIKGKEETRLRSEINRTLEEFLEDPDPDVQERGYYYIKELLEDLPIHFTSSIWFQDGKLENSGIPSVREALFKVLSENYQIQQLVERLEHTLNTVRGRLRAFFAERRSLLDTEFDLSKVEDNLQNIEQDLAYLLNQFQQTVSDLSQNYRREQQALSDLMEANIDRILLLAKEVIDGYAKKDFLESYQALRYGKFGNFKDLGGRVADRIFPIMEATLNKQLKKFSEFLDLTSRSLDGLQVQIEDLELKSAVEGLPKIEFTATKKQFMTDYISELKDRVSNEKDGIIQLLEEFADSELDEKLKRVKDEVADVRGTGTRVRQGQIIESFYSDIGKSLSESLKSFLRRRLDVFGTSLSRSAEGLFPKLKADIEALLVTRKQAIEERLKFQTGEAKERLEAYLESAMSVLDGNHLIGESLPIIAQTVLEEKEVRITEGEVGFSYEMIFGPYLTAADKIDIKEPYLRLRYQLDNFQRFCELISRNGVTRQLELITGSLDGEDQIKSDSRLEEIRSHLKQHGIEMTWKRDPSLHAREIKSSDGWLILSDRGLDIYQKPESRNEFGHFDLALRRCKQTHIHIRRQL